MKPKIKRTMHLMIWDRSIKDFWVWHYDQDELNEEELLYGIEAQFFANE